MTDPMGVAAVGAASYVAHRLFGKTLEEMGSDVNKLYQKGRDRIIIKATEKVRNPEDGKVPNIRVARDVLWNGVVTESEVCAEYFGGILASSRTEDGVDDESIHYVDVIKSLSSSQLHLHYCIYRALQARLLRDGVSLNPGMESELKAVNTYFSSAEAMAVGLNIEFGLPILARNGLVQAYRMDNADLVNGGVLPYFYVTPTTFGTALYAAAFNRLEDWRQFATTDFGAFDKVNGLDIYASSLEDLAKTFGLSLKNV